MNLPKDIKCNEEAKNKRMFFVHLTNMKKYCEYEEEITGGGRYVEQNDYGHELFNFKNDGGKYYGYTTPHCTVDLKKIDKDNIKEDDFGKYVENVLVVFTCSGINGGRVIAGFYQNARVYASALNDNRESRIFKDKYVKYNLICDVANAVLIAQEYRNFSIPRSKSKNSGGYGHDNKWYANGVNDIQIKQDVLKYIYDKINIELLDNDDIDEQETIQESDFASQKEAENSANEELKISKNKQGEAIDKNPKYAKKALQNAKFECQINPAHKTFTTRRGEQYMEGHHLIPCTAKNSKDFKNRFNKNIDCVANIICICPNCHRAVHFGDWKAKEEKIKLMFAKQNNKLIEVGIKITEEELFSLYKTNEEKLEDLLGTMKNALEK